MKLHVVMVYTSFEFGDELHLSSFILISFFSPSPLPAKNLRDFIDLAIVLSLLGARTSNIKCSYAWVQIHNKYYYLTVERNSFELLQYISLFKKVILFPSFFTTY